MVSILSKTLKTKNDNEAKVGKKLDENAGTIEFWLEKIEWDNTDRYYDILNIPTAWGGLFLIKDKSNHLRCLYRSEKYGEMEVAVDVSQFSKGSKHHIAITWTNQKLNIYLDGKLAHTTRRRV